MDTASKLRTASISNEIETLLFFHSKFTAKQGLDSFLTLVDATCMFTVKE